MKFLPIIAACFLVSCAREPLEVTLYTLRDENPLLEQDGFLRISKGKRLYGKVSMAERKELLGQYFTVAYAIPEEKMGQGELVFEFLQASTKSQVNTMRQPLPDEKRKGRQEFAVIGKNYSEKGRVLAWKLYLKVDGETIATKQSFLWE
ncbi:MAG: hypothetical protein ACSHX7_10635 [Luteolibacter sp.]